MLYVSTRDKAASYTAFRTLHEEHAPDGGMFIPFRWPVLSSHQLVELEENNFSANVAQMLNLFFGLELTGHDVTLCIGKNSVQKKSIGHRLVAAELWHNPKGDYCQLEGALYRRMYGIDSRKTPTPWARVAIRLALVCAIFGQMRREGVLSANLVVTSSDPVGLSAAWLARKMGLPINSIIYCCTDQSGMWDFFSHGTLGKGMNGDDGMELLIYTALGSEEVKRYLSAREQGLAYTLDEEQLLNINKGIFPAVVGKKRISEMIFSVYRMNGSVLDTETALAYGGQQDHRANTGETGETLLLGLHSPLKDCDTVCTALGIDSMELDRIINGFEE